MSLTRYAELLTDYCLKVSDGDQVVIIDSTPLALPLIEELARTISRRGAYLIPLFSTTQIDRTVMVELPEERLCTMPALVDHLLMNCEAILSIRAPDHNQAMVGVDPTRRAIAKKARRRLSQSAAQMQVKWTLCNYRRLPWLNKRVCP